VSPARFEEAIISTKVILDVDPGIDDAMALLFAHAAGLDLLAITTVFGNADVDTTTRNALYLNDRFALGAPVFRGAANPLARARGDAPTFIHGHNGLGDVDLGRDQPASVAGDGPAHLAIARLIRANPHEVTVIAVAPLTNLALALEADPGIAGLVKQVVVMGGAFGTGGRSGNVTAVAEANVHNDPHAADRVMTAPWPVTVVGLDVTLSCVMDTGFSAGLAERAGDAGRFLHQISLPYIAAYRRYDGLDGCCLHDVAAVAWVLQPELFQTRRGPVRVITDGAAMGQTVQQPATVASTASGHPAPSVCIGVDAAGLLQLYAATLQAARG
jgi:inosine-uridine nucleoside N-ribohydrolase